MGGRMPYLLADSTPLKTGPLIRATVSTRSVCGLYLQWSSTPAYLGPHMDSIPGTLWISGLYLVTFCESNMVTVGGHI